MSSRIAAWLAVALVLLSLLVLGLTGRRDAPPDSSAIATLDKALEEKAQREQREKVAAAELRFTGLFESQRRSMRNELDQEVKELRRRLEENRRAEERVKLHVEELSEAGDYSPYDEVPDFAGPARRRLEASDSHPPGLARPASRR